MTDGIILEFRKIMTVSMFNIFRDESIKGLGILPEKEIRP